MNNVKYDVELLLPDGQSYYTICSTDYLETLLAVIRALFDCGKGSPGEVKIVVRPTC